MSTLGDLPPDQIRLWMHRIAGWVAQYRETIEQQRVIPDVALEDITTALPPLPPEHPEKLAAIFEDVERFIVPGLVHAGHPRSLGGAGTAPTTPGLIGEWLAIALGPDAPASPTATALERTVLGWIRETLGLAASFNGVVEDSPAAATLRALRAARDAAYPEGLRRGLARAPAFVIYASEAAHGSLDEAASMLGLGTDSIRRVETDPELRLRPAALRAAVARDVNARLRPLAVVATVGTSSCAAIDPVPVVADVCAEHKLWLHVDAPLGAPLAVLPEGRWVLDGVARADSIVVTSNPWLHIAPQLTVLYSRRPELFDARGDQRDLRPLKAWIAMRAHGRTGLEARMREHVQLARRFADWVEADPDFELMAAVTMHIVCFRACPSGISEADADELNAHLVSRLLQGGRVYVTEVRAGRRVAIRLAVGSVLTTEAHLAEAWAIIHDAFDRTLID